MINFTIRSKKELVDEIDRLANLRHVDRSQILRTLIEKGLEKEKLLTAWELYQNGESFERAAEKARVSVWDMIDFMATMGYTKKFELQSQKELYSKILEDLNSDLAEKIRDL